LRTNSGKLRHVGRDPPCFIGRLAELSTKMIDEGVSCCQIGKAPAVKDLLLPNNRTSVMWLNMSRLMKIYDPAA